MLFLFIVDYLPESAKVSKINVLLNFGEKEADEVNVCFHCIRTIFPRLDS
jgi:hypothetical protein